MSIDIKDTLLYRIVEEVVRGDGNAPWPKDLIMLAGDAPLSEVARDLNLIDEDGNATETARVIAKALGIEYEDKEAAK